MSRTKKLHAIGQFLLRRGSQGFINDTRFALLEQILKTGSITMAAKTIGISYRTAWLAVDDLNTLDDGPLVERIAGGKSGGGTSLTKKGKDILNMYRTLRKEHDLNLLRLGAGIANFDRFLHLTQKVSLKTSARNQLFGKIISIQKNALIATVNISLGGKDIIVSQITMEGLDSLGLCKGDSIYALIKANWIDLKATPSGKVKKNPENYLAGEILSVNKTTEYSEYTLRLKGGNTLVVSVLKKERQGMDFKKGNLVIASFKASNVILGLVG